MKGKVLIVASSRNKVGKFSPFVEEQVVSLKKLGWVIDYFPITKGLISNLTSIFKLKKYIHSNHYQLLHAHFVWSGLVAVMQRKYPVIVTYHGCDLNVPKLRFVANKIVKPLSKYSIVVNKNMLQFIKGNAKSCVPCGVDMQLFIPYTKKIAKEELGLDLQKSYVLFSSSFDRIEKNYELAMKVKSLSKYNFEFIEFRGFSRRESVLLYSAVDCLLITSIREGSPQVVKEAMACNCPIVSTNVGDVKEVIGDTRNCYITNFDPQYIALCLDKVLETSERANGRQRILNLKLDISDIAKRLDEIYKRIS